MKWGSQAIVATLCNTLRDNMATLNTVFERHLLQVGDAVVTIMPQPARGFPRAPVWSVFTRYRPQLKQCNRY